MEKIKALVLFSGGLDSILAAKMLEAQGIGITLLCFESYFFSCAQARESARALGMDLRVENISLPQLEIVKRPRHGHGSAVNPCIDCHVLMFATAKAIMDAEGFDIIATGEVLGERPMSQNKQSLDTVERESGLAGILLRPLSAKLLPATAAENNGLVDRSKLGAISGRSRAPQMALAKHFGITHIPQPAGGCILTDPEYGQRIKKLISINPDFDGSAVQILRHCRPIWQGNILFAIARNQAECAALKGLSQPGDFIFDPQNFPGPIVLARNFGKIAQAETLLALESVEQLGKQYILQYSKKAPQNPQILAIRIGS